MKKYSNLFNNILLICFNLQANSIYIHIRLSTYWFTLSDIKNKGI